MKVFIVMVLSVLSFSTYASEIYDLTEIIDNYKKSSGIYSALVDKLESSNVNQLRFESGIKTKVNFGLRKEQEENNYLGNAFNNKGSSIISTVGVDYKNLSGTSLVLDLERRAIDQKNDFVGNTKGEQDSISVELRQKLLKNSFGSIDKINYKIAKLNDENELLKNTNDLEVAVSSYISEVLELLSMRVDLDVLKTSLSNSKLALKVSEKKYKKGNIKKRAYLNAKSSYYETEALSKINNKIYLNRLATVSRKYGLDSSKLRTQVNKLSKVSVSKLKNICAVENIEKNNTLKIIKNNQVVSEHELIRAENSIKPDLDFFVNASSTNIDSSGIDQGSLAFESKPSYAVGLSFSMPIDFSFERENRRKKKIDHQYLKASYELNKRSFKQEQSSKCAELQNRLELVTHFSHLLKAERERIETIKEDYEKGLVTVDEFNLSLLTNKSRMKTYNDNSLKATSLYWEIVMINGNLR
jgi:phosphotransferase system IIB component